jgi:AraC-like DNA-binding protein
MDFLRGWTHHRSSLQCSRDQQHVSDFEDIGTTPPAIPGRNAARGFRLQYAFDRLEQHCATRRMPESPVFVTSDPEYSGDDDVVLSMRPEVGSGYTRFIRLGPGVILALSRFQLFRPVQVSGQQDGHVVFTLNLDGGYQASWGNRSLCVSGQSAMVVAYPSSFKATVEYQPGARQEIVSILFSSAEALRAFGLSRDDQPLLPAPGSSNALGPSMRLATAEAPAIEAAIALQNAPYDGALRRMFMQAKVRELICHILAAPVVADGTRHRQVVGNNARGIAAAVESQLSRWDRHVSVAEIAREMGVSANHLRRVYRSVHGRTIRDAALKARMARARRLLSETRLPIIEIALALGYEHHASFSTAYRKEFGETPMQTRRRCFAPAADSQGQ